MSDKSFTKDNIDIYLKELAKEYRKKTGKSIPAEIVLIGGASVLINYGFRDMTYDIDAIINAAGSMKESINAVSDKYSLPTGWLNDDFVMTESYTPKILRFSKYYHTYSNVITIRTVTGEHLIAMKLKAGRKYKNDLSDIIGILAEHEKLGEMISIEMIKQAVIDLYDSYDAITDEMKLFIEKAIENRNFESVYNTIRKTENENQNTLIEYQKSKPGVIINANANDVIKALRKRKG